MSPEQKQINELKRQVKRLEDFVLSFDNPGAVKPSVKKTIQTLIGTLKLSDLSDVEGTDGASTGQVLKKTSTTWQPGTDNVV